MNHTGWKILSLYVMSLGFFSLTIPVYASDYSGYHNYIELSIELDKTLYKPNEPVEGKVILNNTAPNTLFGSFTVKLYHDGHLKFTTDTYIKTIFTGKTDFTFKNFGIPRINDSPEDSGHWRMVIHPANRNEQSGAQKEFQIEPWTQTDINQVKERKD